MRCDQCQSWDQSDQHRAGNLTVSRCRRAIKWLDATEWADSDTARTALAGLEGPERDLVIDDLRRIRPELEGTKMFVEDADDYKAVLYTAADFFCAHFDPVGPQ